MEDVPAGIMCQCVSVSVGTFLIDTFFVSMGRSDPPEASWIPAASSGANPALGMSIRKRFVRFLCLLEHGDGSLFQKAYVLVHVLNGRHAHSVYSGHGRGLYFPGRPAPLRPANVQLRLGARGIRAYAPRSYPARQVYVGRGSGLRSRRERLPWKYSPLP